MPPSVIGAVIFSALLHATWNAFLKSSPNQSWAVGWIGASTFFVCAPFLPFIGTPSHVWPFIFASATLHVVYLRLLALAYKASELSFAYPIARGSSPMLVAIAGVWFATEIPRPLQIVGIFAIVVGIVAIGVESKNWDVKGLGLALCIGAVIASYTIIDGVGARKSGDAIQYNLWGFSLYGLTMLVIQVSRAGRTALSGSTPAIASAIGGGITSVVAYAIVTWAMVHAPMGMVSALRETSTLFAAGIGILFLKERFSIQKVFACSAIVAGACLIGLG